MSEAEKEKDKGNECFKNKNYKEAIEHYTKSIDLNHKDLHILYANRSLTNFFLKDFEKSLQDADKAISINYKFQKAHFRKGEALLSLKKHFEAQVAFQHWFSLLDPEMNKDIIEETALRAHKEYVNDDFNEITKEIPGIKVEFINFQKGKGVFATKDYKFGDLIFSEEPIVSQRCIDEKDISSCHHCLRTFIPPKKAFPFQIQFLTDDYHYVEEPIKCRSCKIEYCSKECEKQAWEKYHQVLCPKKENKMDQLNKLAKEMKRTNPLLISKMLAAITLQVKKYINDPFVHKKAFQLFSRFSQNQEYHEKDEECFALIKGQILSNSGFDFIQNVISIETYRYFNGLILRNASTITPKSDLQIFIESQKLGTTEISLLYKLFNPNETKMIINIEQLLTCDFMNNLCITGSAPLTIHNSINHSCEPNVTSMSNFNNHKISVIALKDIKKGDELFLSYIDETLDVKNRRKWLEDQYLFKCICEKCQKESK